MSIIVPDSISSIVIEGQTYFPGATIPDEVLDRNPDLKDAGHPLNAGAPKKSKSTTSAPEAQS